MKPADKTIKDVLTRFDEAWTEETVWRVQGTAVIGHKVLERIAEKAGITFDLPTILRSERDEAVIMVVGHRLDASTWSIGEALVNVNYRVSGKQAAYVYAMAEKRAKDRVILKLINLHGMAYSEDEADDLKQGQRQYAPDDDEDARTTSERMRDDMCADLARRAGPDAVDRYLNHPTIKRDRGLMEPADLAAVDRMAAERRGARLVRAAS